VERFTKGSGPGGQKINKVMNCVQLLHLPTRTKVECQQFRALTANRQRARSLLQEKLDLLAFGSLSKVGMRIAKAQKKKASKKARTKKKYNACGPKPRPAERSAVGGGGEGLSVSDKPGG